MSGKEKELVYKDEAYRVIGACFEVYNTMGYGFLESVYQECLEAELAERNIPFESQVDLLLRYKERCLKSRFRADFICWGKVIVEIKASSRLISEDRSQILNYLNATSMKLGLLVNFGHHRNLEYERFVF